MTEQQFIDGLLDRSKQGAFAITIDTRTDARARKTDNPYGRIFKRSRVNGFANWIYGRSVNRQREREGLADDFDAMPRAWGARIEHTPLVFHAGKLYLELKVERSLAHSYETADGTALTQSQVASFLPAKRDDSGRQGVERTVILRDYAISSVVAVVMERQLFPISHDKPGWIDGLSA